MTSDLRPSVDATRVALTDGREVTVRQLLPDDEQALVTAIAAADPADLRRRFMGCPPPVSMLVERLRQADGIHNFALGAFTDDGVLVGVAQFDRVDEEPAAEIAVAIATAWQNHGLGTTMLTMLAGIAHERGVEHLTGTFQADNLPLRRLLRDADSVVTTSYDAGEGYVDVDLEAT